MGVRTVFVVAVAMMSVGCLTKHEQVVMRTGQGEAMPVIKIRPGYEERIALMDRYRLHDEDRKHMMRRPHVWVEEVPDDELPPAAETETNEQESGAQPTHAAAPAP
jgi:hypothetical protein